MNKCNSCAYNTVCSGEHEGCRYLPATVIVCQMCGEEIKEDEEVFTVEVDGTEMEVCGECERFFEAPKELRELHFFDGWCPEFAGVHLHKDDVCHPNIGREETGRFRRGESE